MKYAKTFSSNLQQTLFCRPSFRAKEHSDHSCIGGLFRPYTDLNLLELIDISENGITIKVDKQLSIADFYGKTAFDILEDIDDFLPAL